MDGSRYSSSQTLDRYVCVCDVRKKKTRSTIDINIFR